MDVSLGSLPGTGGSGARLALLELFGYIAERWGCCAFECYRFPAVSWGFFPQFTSHTLGNIFFSPITRQDPDAQPKGVLFWKGNIPEEHNLKLNIFQPEPFPRGIEAVAKETWLTMEL